jgi:peptide/nickel transport system substrate-binding protein
MTRKRLLSAIAIAGVASLALAACTTSADTTTPSKSGKTVTIAQVNEATSFNYNTPQGNLDTNGLIWQMTQPQFFTFDQQFNIVHNKDLGSYEKTSDSPLTVKYTLKSGLKWSDGKPMNADDLMLGWAQSSGYYESATLNDKGDVTAGVQYFASAAGYPWASAIPKVSSDNLSITIKYTKPYVDWELVNPIQFPAHIVAKQAGVSEADLMKAIKDTPAGDTNNPASVNKPLQKAASFINTGYDATSLPTSADTLVSGGPLKVTGWTPKQSMTFTPNADYVGSHSVKFSKLVMRFIGDANAQVTALQNGEVDAIQPQASADTVTALKKISGVTVIQGNQVAYDHLDLNFKASVFKDPKVREAFLLTVPREQILKAIVTPVIPDAKVLDSQIWLPGQPQYADAVKANGSSAYDKVDIDKAKSLLAGKTPTVKILYNTNNPNRVNSFQAIQASAKLAGFNVTDGGSPQWSSLLSGGDYDASIFGWVNPGAGNAQLPQLFQTGNSGNYNNYADAAASDLAVESQSTLDLKKLDAIKLKIDKMAFTDGYGLTLFQLPGLFATGSKLKGVKWFGGQNGIIWNVWDWTKK